MTPPFTCWETWVQTPPGKLFVRTWNPVRRGAEREPDIPIILFHDSLGSVELWRGFPEALCLATGRPIIAYDRLGFGKSDPFRGEWTSNFIREEARTYFPVLRERLGIEAFIAMGHSVGGAMAALCAAAFPSACRALVTESAQALVEDRTLEGIREAKAAFQQVGQRDRLAKYHGDKAPWVLDAWTETWLSPEFRSWNLDRDLADVVCPALVIHGEQDEYGSARHPMRLAEAMAGEAQVELLPGRRHVPHREDEAAVVALIASFLARVDR